VSDRVACRRRRDYFFVRKRVSRAGLLFWIRGTDHRSQCRRQPTQGDCHMHRKTALAIALAGALSILAQPAFSQDGDGEKKKKKPQPELIIDQADRLAQEEGEKKKKKDEGGLMLVQEDGDKKK